MLHPIQGARAAYTENRTSGQDTGNKESLLHGTECGEAYVLELSGSDGETACAGTGNRLGADEIERLKEQTEMNSRTLRDLVEKLIVKQGNNSMAFAGISISITVDPADSDTVLEAQKAISEDGAFGVKAVSDRIVAFAKAISGNDPGRLSELKNAIDKGFEMAGEVFGGTLPDLCGETHDEIMRKLDDWSRETQDAGIDLTA